jgi:hypothetical protein
MVLTVPGAGHGISPTDARLIDAIVGKFFQVVG